MEVRCRVRLSGLKSRPDLNGTVAVVIRADTVEEHYKLVSNDRVQGDRPSQSIKY